MLISDYDIKYEQLNPTIWFDYLFQLITISYRDELFETPPDTHKITKHSIPSRLH